jgi:hypothetical protein
VSKGLTKRGKMITTPEGINLYGETDVQPMIDTAVAEARLDQINKTQVSVNNTISSKVMNVILEEVKNDVFSKDYGTELYNKIANACNWDEITNILPTYSASVEFNGQSILEISDIEADDEDDAQQKVWDSLSIDDINISFSVTALDQYGDYDGSLSYRMSLDDEITENIEVNISED